MKTGAEAIRALATQLPSFRQKLSDGWYQVRIAGRDVSESGVTAQLHEPLASEHIAPLQDAADLEIATEEETSLLEAWKKYRVLLNRIDTSTAPDIEWPTSPAE